MKMTIERGSWRLVYVVGALMLLVSAFGFCNLLSAPLLHSPMTALWSIFVIPPGYVGILMLASTVCVSIERGGEVALS